MIFSPTYMQTGCPLDANNVICIDAWLVDIRPVCHEKRWWGLAWPFRRRWGLFIVCTRHASSRVHAIFFCCPPFGLHTHLLYHTAIHWKSQARCRHVRYRSTGACGAFICLRVFVSKCMLTCRWWFVSCGNLRFILWYISPGTACLYSGPSPANVACLRNHLLHTYRYWYCGRHPQDTAERRDRSHHSSSGTRALVCLSVQLLLQKNKSAVRSRISSKRIFASCVEYFDFVQSKTSMRCGLLYF